ncbi:MAG: GNAT family N-acetyltransferase [Planctomycetaceae bacterium]
MSGNHSPIFLKDVASGELREAVLQEGIRGRHLADVDEVWQPALSVLQRWSGQSRREESAHWDWRTKMRDVRRSRKQRSFAIEFHDLTQGLMIVDTSRKARLDPDCDQGLVYVDYVEVAPWNRHGWLPHRLFHSVGTLFLKTPIQTSLDLGFDGRIGLHSLPQADTFYSHFGMTNLGADAANQDLMLF